MSRRYAKEEDDKAWNTRSILVPVHWKALRVAVPYRNTASSLFGQDKAPFCGTVGKVTYWPHEARRGGSVPHPACCARTIDLHGLVFKHFQVSNLKTPLEGQETMIPDTTTTTPEI